MRGVVLWSPGTESLHANSSEVPMSPKKTGIAIALCIAVLGAAAAKRVHPPAEYRSCSDVLSAQVCTWAVVQDGDVVELGATVPLSMVEAVTPPPQMVWPPQELATVPIPEEARQALGIDHLGINWEAFGHPPESFTTPHFDFHFYNITSRQVGAIDCTDTSKPARLPAQYTLPDVDVPGLGTLVGLCVPHMGMHAMLDKEVAETAPFEASMMVGYYAGRPIFIEPMISRDVLLSRKTFSIEVPTVRALPKGVRYPTRFRAEYDADRKAYRLIFSGFGSDVG